MIHPRLSLRLAAALLAAAALSAPVAADESSAAPGEPPRSARSTVAQRRHDAATAANGSQGWWTGTAAMVVVLVAAGVLCIAARKQAETANGGRLRVLGRVGLPPKHAVFLVRAGGRTLLIGTGPQGAPSLLGELDEDDEEPAATPSRSDPAARPARPIHVPQPRIDVRLGGES